MEHADLYPIFAYKRKHGQVCVQIGNLLQGRAAFIENILTKHSRQDGHLEEKITTLENKLSQSKVMHREQVNRLNYVITTIDNLENRNRQNNIRVRGLPIATGSEKLMPML